MKKSKEFIKLCEEYGVDPDNVPEILSFESACADQKIDPNVLPIVNSLPENYRKRSISDYKLTIIAAALRGGKNVDYTKSSWKYFPVFEVEADKKRPSGFGLSYYDYGLWTTRSDVGVRLCFPNRDLAVFFGKHFIDLHTDHQLLT